MSDGSLLQLVALGEADAYLYDQPIITFFKRNYKKHTNFSIESIIQKFKGFADFGETINCVISRHGDLIWRTYIEVTLSPIVTTDENTYCNRVGFKLLKKVELRIGGKTIDYHYSHWMHIWTELTHNVDMKSLLNKMVGNKTDDGQLGANNNPGTLMIPLLFFFCRNPGLALPLIALQYHEIEIIIEFDYFNNLISDLNTTNNISQGTMSNVSIWVDYVFLDTEERKHFSQTTHDYLIETTQSQEISISANKTNCVKLDFNHPTKMLAWALKDNSFVSEPPGTVCYTPLISSLGGGSTMVVRSDGYLWGWGLNSSGQLGLGNTTTPQTTPIIIPNINMNDVKFISSGNTNTFIIKQDGTLWATGLNTSGQLGLGNNTNRTSFTKVGTATNWSFVSNKGNHTLAIKTDGTLWGTGSNTSGQLGLGNNNTRNTFIQIGSSIWINCVAQGTHSAAIKNDFTLWTTGSNTTGQLGLGNLLNKNVLTQVITAGINTWSKIAGSSAALAGIKTDGTLWTWGNNADGQLGLGNTTNYNSPQQVGISNDYNNVYGSLYTIYVKKNNNTVWASGYNLLGGLGSGNYINSAVFIQIGSSQWMDVQAGEYHVWLIDTTYNMYFLGYNGYAQLGMNYFIYPHIYPTLYNDTSNWLSYVVSSYILLIKPNRTLWAIGVNTNGQLGLGDLITRNYLTQVGSDTNWSYVTTEISSGYTYASAGIKTDGSLYTWGTNASGMLGLGNLTNYYTPQKVGTSTWRTISIGYQHMGGIKTDGTLWTWGYGGAGSLGNGNNVSSYVPIKIGVATDWLTVKCGEANTFAIKNNGTLWATGGNGSGSLGLGISGLINTFTQVGTDTWSYITTSGYSTLGIKTDETLWSCGGNTNGQLGLGNTTSYNTFQQVGSDKWSKISNNNAYYVKGIKSNGTLWSWGNTSALSLGTAIISSPQTTPLQLGTDTDWIDVQGGNGSGLAIKSNNTKYIWGNNGSILNNSAKNIIDLTESNFVVDNCVPVPGAGISLLDNFTYYGSSSSVSSLSSAKLIVNNNERIRERDSIYFNYIQPYQHFNIKADLGINMYSFALKPAEYQPSGTFNLSKVHKLQLEITPTNNPDNTDEIPLTLYIYAFSYNILRIAEGMGGLAFN